MRDLVEVTVETNGAPAMLAAIQGRRGRPTGRTVTVNLAQSPLAWLAARELIDARAYEAGERQRADYERAALPPGVTMRWSPARAKSTTGADPTATQIDARRRFDRAIAAVGRTFCGAWSAWANRRPLPNAISAGRRAAGGWC